MAKHKIVMVSACLLGRNCKYNGGNNFSLEVIERLRDAQIIPFCPEEEGGLTTPRLPCEIKDGVVVNSAGVNVNEEFVRGANLGVQEALKNGVTLAVLQPRSPSCGVKRVYDGNFCGKLVDGSGVFASALRSAGITVCEPQDLDAILNED